jgi:hypothetical protein
MPALVGCASALDCGDPAVDEVADPFGQCHRGAELQPSRDLTVAVRDGDHIGDDLLEVVFCDTRPHS